MALTWHMHCRLSADISQVTTWEALWKPATLLCPSWWGCCGTGPTKARMYWDCTASHCILNDLNEAGPRLHMHACLRRFTNCLKPSEFQRHACTEDPWLEGLDVQKIMMNIYEVVSTMGRISSGFAARLVHAGALNALFCLDGQLFERSEEAPGHEAGVSGTSTPIPEAGRTYKGRTQPGWAAGLGAGARAGATAAQYQIAALECINIFAGSVPQVTTWG